MDMPSFSEDGLVWVWDESAKGYRRMEKGERPSLNHSDGTEAHLLDPVRDRMLPKNPLGEGMMAQANMYTQGPFPNKVPRPNFETYDNENPSMLNKDHGADLNHCPDCGGNMVENGADMQCPNCGAMQPIKIMSHNKESFVPALAMGLGRLALPIAGRVLPSLAGGAAAGTMGAGEAAAVGGAAAGAAEGATLSGGALAGQAMRGAQGMGMSQGAKEAISKIQESGDFTHWDPIANQAVTSSHVSNYFGAGDGVAVEIRGEDCMPDVLNTGGYHADHGDSPEFLKDVHDAGGNADPTPTEEDIEAFVVAFEEALTDEQREALEFLDVNLPLILTYAMDDELDGNDHPIIKEIDEKMEAAFPGYKDMKEELEEMDENESSEKENKDTESKESRTKWQSSLIESSFLGMEIDSDTYNLKTAGEGCINCGSKLELDGRGMCRRCTDSLPLGWTDVEEHEDTRKDRAEESRDHVIGDPDEWNKQGSIHEARRLPKMCPHHKNLVQYALATGDANAALSAMSQHEYGAKSCNGDWKGDHSCKFKPAMVTETFWNDRDSKRQEKQEQRAEQQRELEQAQVDFTENQMEIPESDSMVIDLAEVDSSPINTTVEYSAPETAVGQPMEMAASTHYASDLNEGDRVTHNGESGYISKVWNTLENRMLARVVFDNKETKSVPLDQLQPEAEQGSGFFRTQEPSGLRERMNLSNTQKESSEYELVDKTDNDAHDSGSKEEMEQMAKERNESEGTSQWVAKPKGWSERNFKDAASEDRDVEPRVSIDEATDSVDGNPWVDTDGNTLKEGSHYMMKTPNYKVPDRILVESVDNNKLTYVIETAEMKYRDRMSEDELASNGYEFQPMSKLGVVTASHKCRGCDEGTLELDDDGDWRCPKCHSAWASTSDSEGNERPDFDEDDENNEKESSTRSVHASLMQDRYEHARGSIPEEHLPPKTAGARFSPMEQQDFIDEGVGTLARNIRNLNLENSHYDPTVLSNLDNPSEIDEHFNW